MILDELRHLFFQNGKFARTIGKCIVQCATDIELNRWQCNDTELLDKVFIVLNGQIAKNQRQMLVLFRIFELYKLGFQTLAGATPRCKDFENDELVAIGLYKLLMFLLCGDVINAIVAQ